MENTVTEMRLETYAMRLYGVLCGALSDGARRLDYDDLAARVGCSRSAVRYNVGKLLSAGMIGTRDGKLYLV